LRHGAATHCFQPALLDFSHFWPEVAETLHIGAYPFASSGIDTVGPLIQKRW
jgi:hypothetical protein